MYRTLLKSEIRNVTVTGAHLHCSGSVTIDADLCEAADLTHGERVAVLNSTNGARLETYVVEGERGTGIIAVNGAAAHLVRTGDTVAIASYATISDAAATRYRPRIVTVDAHNRRVPPTDVWRTSSVRVQQ
jgi:aspartate 1-decarboxylase